jgi:hypothetical protein
VGEVIDYLRSLARRKAVNGRTGWARWYDIHVAYYPLSDRYAYFLHPLGAANRRDVEAHIGRIVQR